jgi:pimeloyl-ACP methyl ester carboxylesterase
MRLSWRAGTDKELVASGTNAYRREEVPLNGSGGLLGCDVLMPTGAGRYPGVVLVPGAGANDRYNVYMMAEVFATHGVAALTCDKRGTGTSEGDWRLTSFEQQAQDIGVGARFLRQRREIDSTRVGVWALSEGTWVAPIMVAANPQISFLILVAASATSRREGVLISNAEMMRRGGASAAEITRYREFFVRYQQAIMDNDAVAIGNLWKEYSGASWLPPNMPTAQTLNDWSWQRARLTWPYEPGPVLSKITCPVLAIWGAEDEEMLPRIEKPLLERAMLSAGNRDFTTKVIPGADHTLRTVAPTFVQETGYAPEYIRTVLEWLKPRVRPAGVKQ